MRFAPKLRPKTDEERLLPLINVVFLLLLFFVVAGRLAASDPFRVDPPHSVVQRAAEAQHDLIVLGHDGRLALDGLVLTEDDLIAALASRRKAAGTALAVKLKADGAVETLRVVALLERLRAAGVESVTLLTVPPSAPT